MLEKKRTAFAGPWIGEFAWEFMTWVPYLRKLSREYDKMYISTFEGVEALYTGFHCEVEFIPHEYNTRSDEWRYWHDLKYDLPEVQPCGFDHIVPIKEYRVDGEYIRYGSPVVKDIGVLFHARGIEKGANKNWSEEKWLKLTEQFPGGRSIGSVDDLLVTKGDPFKHDWRDTKLQPLMDVIASAAVVIGGSSGVMHLALMCGTPIVTWGDCNNFDDTLKNRYMKTWNPFGTPVTWVGDTWDPEVEQIMEAIKPKHNIPDAQALSTIYDAIQSGRYLLSAAHIVRKDDKDAILSKSVAINFPDHLLDQAAKQMANDTKGSIVKVRAERIPVSWR